MNNYKVWRAIREDRTDELTWSEWARSTGKLDYIRKQDQKRQRRNKQRLADRREVAEQLAEMRA